MKIQFLKKEKKFKKENLTINVGFYWKIILYVVFTLIVSFFAFGFYLFLQIDKGPSVEEVLPVKSDVVQKERIDKVLNGFSVKEEKTEEILNTVSPVVDPSL